MGSLKWGGGRVTIFSCCTILANLTWPFFLYLKAWCLSDQGKCWATSLYFYHCILLQSNQWLQWELLLYDVMHVCSICTSVQLLVISKESSVYCASVQFTVFHVELQIAVFHCGKEFCCSSLCIHTVAVVSLRLLQQQLFKRQGRRELCVCGVASSD